MAYSVKEIFYSLQGEGLQAGRPAIFVRFSGCNLSCPFCDTDFAFPAKKSGGIFHNAADLAAAALSLWPDKKINPYIIFTGGEPLLQLDEEICAILHRAGATLAVETNGTISTDLPLDWITVSPKMGAALQQDTGSELKLVYPQPGLNPADYQQLDFTYFFLQPCFDNNYQANLQETIAYCQKHPLWRLSVQLHRIIGVE